ELQKIELHYTAKENILFPQLEAHWKEYGCLKLMWSFHDDIRQNLKQILALIISANFDLKTFNKLAGLLFFNISTIIFREERILFPTMTETLIPALMDKMLIELAEMKLPFIKIKNPAYKIKKEVDSFNKRIINFSSGKISIEQIELIFNHLPVDITFVDEYEKVCFFSSPKHRIFPRSASIIGREVQNCHPPDSVDVVNRIIESFKSGEKENASFWLKLGEKFVLIQYFAVRDTNQNYRGVLEVSQEISEIQSLSGEKKLLDW
ncbi:MAG: PAS domain-containing protein, partial [Bacteroidota bacterium]